VADDSFEDMPDITRSRGGAPILGDLDVPIDDGVVTCEQAPDLRTGHIVTEKAEVYVTVIVVGIRHGAYVALSPKDARLMAQGLLRSADAAEAGYGVRAQ